MGKNNRFINSMNELARKNRENNIHQAIDRVLPQFYASTALALRKEGYGQKRILRVLEETRKIFEEFEYNAKGIVDKCQEETGIKIKIEEE